MKYNWPHRWSYCGLCETTIVICGKCGNNSCNGGVGRNPDNTDCEACPESWEFEQNEKPPVMTEEEKAKLKIRYEDLFRTDVDKP